RKSHLPRRTSTQSEIRRGPAPRVLGDPPEARQECLKRSSRRASQRGCRRRRAADPFATVTRRRIRACPARGNQVVGANFLSRKRASSFSASPSANSAGGRERMLALPAP